MAINLNNAENEEGVWVEYDEDVSFKLRHLSPKKTAAIRKKFVTRKLTAGSWSESVQDKDTKKHDKALYDHIIEDWKGVELGNVDAECTADNKVILMDYSIDISNFIIEKAKNIYEQKEQKVEEEIKN